MEMVTRTSAIIIAVIVLLVAAGLAIGLYFAFRNVGSKGTGVKYFEVPAGLSLVRGVGGATSGGFAGTVTIPANTNLISAAAATAGGAWLPAGTALNQQYFSYISTGTQVVLMFRSANNGLISVNGNTARTLFPVRVFYF